MKSINKFFIVLIGFLIQNTEAVKRIKLPKIKTPIRPIIAVDRKKLPPRPLISSKFLNPIKNKAVVRKLIF